MGPRILAQGEVETAVTSEGQFVFEASTGESGIRKVVTRYDATLEAGVNFTDTDQNGRVSSLDEKATITAGVVKEVASEYALDLQAGTQIGQTEITEFSDGAVSDFILDQFDNTLTLSVGDQVSQLQLTGNIFRWSGDAAATAATSENPDTSAASQAGRYRVNADLTTGASVTDYAVTNSSDGSTLAYGRLGGTIVADVENQQATGSYDGDATVYERSGTYDLQNELTLTDSGFTFEATANDTLVTLLDLTCNFTISLQSQVVECTAVDSEGNTVSVISTDGNVEGTITTTINGETVTVATISVDSSGNGTITFIDGTTVDISDYDLSELG